MVNLVTSLNMRDFTPDNNPHPLEILMGKFHLISNKHFIHQLAP